MNNFMKNLYMSREETTNKIRNEGVLIIEWCVDDVKERCPLLDDNESKEVLECMHDNYDDDIGINCEVIDDFISKLYPEKWAKYIEEYVESNLTGRFRSVDY